MTMNPRTGRPFINPRFADLLSEPELFGLGRKPSPEPDTEKAGLVQCDAVQSETFVTAECRGDDRRCMLTVGHASDHEGYCPTFEGPFWFTEEETGPERVFVAGKGPCKECGVTAHLLGGLCISCDYGRFRKPDPRMATRMSYGPSYAGAPVKTEQELAEYQQVKKLFTLEGPDCQ